MTATGDEINMSLLKAIYESDSEIPEGYKDLFTARNGKFELTGIEGVKTQADIDRLQTSLTKERNDHSATKNQLRAYSALGELEEVQAKLDKYPELETAAAGKIDDAKINEMVETRIKTRLAPIERERDRLKTDLSERDTRINEFTGRERTRAIHDAVRKATVEFKGGKFQPTALDDALLLAEKIFDVDETGNVVVKDQVGFTPGLAPSDWIGEIADRRPHWFEGSAGGGAKGGKANGGFINNPWAKETFNLTEQGRLYKENPERARQMATAAGQSID
jgi:hypothetical protein